jgi:hypothetical protein
MKARHHNAAAFCLAIFPLVVAYAPPRAGPAGVRAERLGKLRAITRKCGLPESALKLIGTKELLFQLSPNASYRKVDCMLKALKKAHLPLNTGFVGNEADQPEETNAAPH